MKEIKQVLAEVTQGMQTQLPIEVLTAFGDSIADLKTQEFGRVSEVGMAFPSVPVVDENEQLISIVDLFKGKKALVSFVRGSWCPFCNVELAHLMSYQKELEEKGVEVIVVSPMNVALLKKWKAEMQMPFRIVQDWGLAIGKALGINFELQDFVQPHYEALGLDLKLLNQTEKVELSVPAVYFVDEEGMIGYRYLDVDYSNRLDLKSIL